MTPLYSALAGPRKASDLRHINLFILAERKGVATWKLFTEQYPMQKSLWFCFILRVISLHFNANAYQMDDSICLLLLPDCLFFVGMSFAAGVFGAGLLGASTACILCGGESLNLQS